MEILDSYLKTVHVLEEYRDNLSPSKCESHYDFMLRVQCLDEEIVDMYFAINLMRN